MGVSGGGCELHSSARGGAAADLFELGLDGGQLLGLECEMLREQDVVDFPGL